MSKFGKDLIEAMSETLAHVEGAATGVAEHRIDLEAIDPCAIRKSLDLAQDQMAPATPRQGAKK